MRRTTAVLPALALAASLGLAGCGASDKAGSPAAGSTPVGGSSTAPDAPILSPLTGRTVSAKVAGRPVMVVKIDNTYASSPQLGLGRADLVVEELVEGGLTRLAAFYQSGFPTKVGPVRSMRASDIGIVSPVKGDIVTSGAATRTIKRIQNAGITFFEEGAKGLSRDYGRRAPYNLFSDLAATATLAKSTGSSASYLTFGSASDLPAGRSARSVSATFGGGRTSQWTYQAGTYRNTNSFAAQGDRFNATSVLVLRVKVGDAGYRDPAGNPVPETKLVGSGSAVLFSGGKAVAARWTKADLGSPIELSAGGSAVAVPAGRTWIELVPASGGNVTYR